MTIPTSKFDDYNKVYLWGTNLAWELFSSAVFNYRLGLKETRLLKKHHYFKNIVVNSVTAVEAFCNEILATDLAFNWKEKEIAKCRDKLQALGVNYNDEKLRSSKFIRNNFIIHHKRDDHTYFGKINQYAALDAIESTQEVIAEICFVRGRMFPYWITGLNFITPDGDISLMNDYEFWCRFKWLNVSKVVNEMVSSSGEISPPSDRKIYFSLYKDLWDKINQENFTLNLLNKFRDPRFPQAPFLTAEWWD